MDHLVTARNGYLAARNKIGQVEFASVSNLAARNSWATARNETSRISQASVSESYGPQYRGYGPQHLPKFINFVPAALFEFVTARNGLVAARNTPIQVWFQSVLVCSVFSFRFSYDPASPDHLLDYL